MEIECFMETVRLDVILFNFQYMQNVTAWNIIQMKCWNLSANKVHMLNIFKIAACTYVRY